MTHDEFEVDVEVWHNPDDVALGIDAVVQAAVNWIDSLTVDINESDNDSYIKNKIKCYPNPFSTSTTIEFELSKPGNVTIKIFNHLGELVDLTKQYQLEGKQQLLWDAENLPSGIYFIKLETENWISTRKIIKK